MMQFDEGVVVPAGEFPVDDAGVAPFFAALGLDGIIDIHVHAMPDSIQQAVWRFFDVLDSPPWPITYRADVETRLGWLRDLGVLGHTALAYPHKPGMLSWLNTFTLDLADAHPQVIPTFTIYPEPGVTDAVAAALEHGGAVCKVHVQVGEYHLADPLLDDAWRLMSEAGTVVVNHASAVYGVAAGAEYCGGAVVDALATRFPDLTLVIAHLGMPDVDGSMWDAIAKHPRVFTDVSMALTDPIYGNPGEEPFTAGNADRLRGELADKLVYGSDFPSIPHHVAAQVRGLAKLELDPAGLRAILFERAAGLLAEAGWTVPPTVAPPSSS